MRSCFSPYYSQGRKSNHFKWLHADQITARLFNISSMSVLFHKKLMTCFNYFPRGTSIMSHQELAWSRSLLKPKIRTQRQAWRADRLFHVMESRRRPSRILEQRWTGSVCVLRERRSNAKLRSTSRLPWIFQGFCGISITLEQNPVMRASLWYLAVQVWSLSTSCQQQVLTRYTATCAQKKLRDEAKPTCLMHTHQITVTCLLMHTPQSTLPCYGHTPEHTHLLMHAPQSTLTYWSIHFFWGITEEGLGQAVPL